MKPVFTGFFYEIKIKKMNDIFLKSVIKQMHYYKGLGENTMAQLSDEQLYEKLNEENNSIYNIVKHLSGNMLSRWTDFLTTDGEKEWRERDAEFEETRGSREQLMVLWESGWDCLFGALNSLTDIDLHIKIKIRNEEHTVLEAIHRQLAHYPYHVGQIVFIGKYFCNTNWKSLSIPKGKSEVFNEIKFRKENEPK